MKKHHHERVLVELVNAGTDREPVLQVVRIFRNDGEAAASAAWDENRIMEYPRDDAVAAIRKNVFIRCHNECENCGKFITFSTGHLDERVSRGKGGEISVDNCQFLCANCHIIGPESKHGARLPRFGPQTGQGEN
jgi:hypothetical protein